MFIDEFKKHKDEFCWLYMELYNDRESLDKLIVSLEDIYNNRKPELKELDKKRKADPDWYKSSDMFGITMYTELFAGDIVGLKKRIPYLKELGIKYLHLMPLLKMPKGQNDGGYAVEDFNTVDEKFGTNKELIDLCDSLRHEGISLCLDFVMNHTASTHTWAMRAKEGEQKYRDYYHIYPNYDIPREFEKTLPQVFPSTAPGNFTFDNDLNAFVMTTFYPYQWDLNYANPAVFGEMLIAMLRLCNMGVDVLRLDAVPYIWKELYTTSRNLPKVHTILRLMRIAIECVAPGCLLKGEVVMAPKELKAYFGTEDKPECHMLYSVSSMVNFWSALASQDARLLRRELDILFNFGEHCYFLNYLRCHDDIGWGLDENAEREFGIDPLLHKIFLYNFFKGDFEGSYARGELYNYDNITKDARTCGTTASLCGLESARWEKDKDKAIGRILFMHALMMSIKGLPMLNSGDEIAQLNNWDYTLDEDKKHDSRYLHRSKFNWNALEDIKAKKGPVYEVNIGIKKLYDIRSHESLFCNKARVYTYDTRCDNVLAIVHELDGEHFVALFNFCVEPRGAFLPNLEGKFTDLITGKSMNMEDGIMLKGQSFVWLRSKRCQKA